MKARVSQARDIISYLYFKIFNESRGLVIFLTKQKKN